jgi:excinuclease ABC subunit A
MPAENDACMEPERDSSPEVIRIRGARVHNLKHVDVDIPRNRLVVITGPSGSGKSSLAFDTLYAEGQRQYIESLSVYARQFLHQLERPDVDAIDGLQPTICIDQRPGHANPRSTVATVTEVYDYLRVLLARVGEVACHQCGAPICQQNPEQILASLMSLPEGTKVMLLAPLVRGRRGRHEDALARIRKAGFVRARIDGRVYDIDGWPELLARQVHDIDAVVDRIVIRAGMEPRLGESLRLALRHGEGIVVACYQDAADEHATANGTWRERLFSTRYACPQCQISFEDLEPRTFSFNSPYGACPRCEGLGRVELFDPELVLPDLSLSLAQGALAPWKNARAAAIKRLQAHLAEWPAEGREPRGESRERRVRAPRGVWETPLDRLGSQAVRTLLHGDGQRFPGVLLLLEQEYACATREDVHEQLARFRGQVLCPACAGSRLRPEANSVRVAGKTIAEWCRMTIDETLRFLGPLQFPEIQRPIAAPLLAEIRKRLEFLQQVGVAYVTLDRPADTLSGGELQRVRLATSIGSGLVGVCYVLDEPSIGLHPRDNGRLIAALRDLQRQGNTVLVVEHDEAMMRAADYVIDVGPGAGAGGGQIVAHGAPDAVARDDRSLTGRYLSRAWQIPLPVRRRRIAKMRSLAIEGVTTNNLQDVAVRFPLGALVCVTGVSGSGKSSLVNETLAWALLRRLGGLAPKPGPHTRLRGVQQIDKVIRIDQAPIGRTPRSNPATYTGAFDEIRKVFASTREARQRGYRANRFSFNVKGGRCEGCQGHGLKRIEMNFLPDLYVTCDECGGARFNRQTLDIRYRSRSIADVLAMSVEEGCRFLESFPAIVRVLHSLRDVGLGYLQLGQSSTTLSGGEAQRIKLATELARVDTGRTLYLLDEPTTGLHFDDIRRLLEVLGRLVDRGNTVIVIEHNLDVIKCADWIIDLGPEGGQAGGWIVVEGTPEEVAAHPTSHTGRFLRPVLHAVASRGDPARALTGLP